MSILDIARPELRSLQPYQAAAQVVDTVRLNANEAPTSNAADPFRRKLNRYPQVRPAGIRAALATRFACTPEQLLVTRGTSEAIDLLVRGFCRAGLDNVVSTSPTFSMYQHYAEIQGAEMREVAADADDDFRVDAAALLAACDENTRIVFVCTPNNPTGTTVPRATIIELLQQLSGRALVIVDEAYIEFADTASSSDLLDKYENLVVLRTLSKALAFAGARCGAVLAAADAIGLLNAIQAPYALATPVVECVEDALQDHYLEAAAAEVQRIVSERQRMTQALQTFDIVERIWPSAANFVLVRVKDVERIRNACERRKVLLRYLGGTLSECIRITIGTPDENNLLLQILAELEGAD